jgi:hypothetical protein
MARKSVNLKHSLVLKVALRFKPAAQYLERYDSAVSYTLIIQDLISNNFYKFGILTYCSVHFTHQLTDIRQPV